MNWTSVIWFLFPDARIMGMLIMHHYAEFFQCWESSSGLYACLVSNAPTELCPQAVPSFEVHWVWPLVCSERNKPYSWDLFDLSQVFHSCSFIISSCWTNSQTDFLVSFPGTKSFPFACTASFHTSTSLAEDYYQILGVPRNASRKDIRKAYLEVCIGLRLTDKFVERLLVIYFNF